MKANFIHTWSVESEFVIENSFFFFLDIRVSINLAFFFEKIGLFLALFEHFCTGNTGYKAESQFFVTIVASTYRIAQK